MNSIIYFCLILSSIVQTNGYHTQFDIEKPAINWKECGIGDRTVCGSNSRANGPFVSTRIWGGVNASTGDYPFYALLLRQFETSSGSDLQCGAAVINEWWVLTAGHCIIRPGILEGTERLVVSVGSVARKAGRKLAIDKIIIHPTYAYYMHISNDLDYRNVLRKKYSELEILDNTTDIDLESVLKTIKDMANKDWIRYRLQYRFDVILLKMKDRIVPFFNDTFYQINSLCLPRDGIINEDKEYVHIMGCGRANPNEMSGVRVKKGILELVKQCKKQHDLGDRIACGKMQWYRRNPLLNSSICSGDSGSPQTQYVGCQAVQIGLTSMGFAGSGGCSWDSGLARISMHIQWIRSVILRDKLLYKFQKRVDSQTGQLGSESVSMSMQRKFRKPNYLLIWSTVLLSTLAVVICSTTLWITAKTYLFR